MMAAVGVLLLVLGLTTGATEAAEPAGSLDSQPLDSQPLDPQPLDPQPLTSTTSRAAGEILRLEPMTLDDGEAPVVLELERFEVLGPRARIVVHGEQGIEVRVPPQRELWRGRVDGDDSSLAILSVSGEATWQGWISTRGRWFEIAGEADASPRVREIDLTPDSEPPGGGTCAADSLPEVRAFHPRPTTSRDRGPTEAYAIDLAIETDWEYFQLFGSVETATDYIIDRLAAASAIYERDIGTELRVSEVILWTVPEDPWTVEGDLFAALLEVGDHWHRDHPLIDRTLAHFVSGKSSLAGGIGWGGVLCSPDFPYEGHWGGGYSLSGSWTAFGSFRDTWVVSHELGHNFDSRHTHCYNDRPLPGDPPIDQCYSGDSVGGHVCYEGTTSLPPDGGSVMSYCHLQPGGYANINLWLGRKGSFGVRSERVPEKMLAHVQSVAACLPPADNNLFADGFESGDTSAWSQTVPSLP